MIAVDANVVSELMKATPDQRVLHWAAAVPQAQIAIPTIVCAELLRGVDRLPQGRRRSDVEGALDVFFSRVHSDNLLAFDSASAVEYATIMTARDASGRPMPTMDALIAAICRAHGAKLATRNTKDFGGAGVELVDPWSA